ncbi:MAG TPA: T9SS type A sorting domain-containing protein, partial [Bacteroidota bacterium]|nr:T9SS type A sorting domain-containing protein [Bacteroidota bacterium]
WANGMIIRSAGTKALTKTVANDKLTETLNSLRITDSRHKSQILYFGIQGMSVSNANLGRYILPPPSPGGTIDARFDGDQSVALFRVVASSPTSYRIHIRGAAYPLTISWKTNPAQGEYGEAVYSLFSSGTGALLTPNVIGTGSIQITNSNAGDLELTSMSSSGNTVPKQFELTQNFPNPFNPATTISYGLPSDGFVTLKIYNALGELVTTLVSGEQTRGRHLAVWNAGNYSSGIYWYRMVAPGFVATKQMVVMK